MRKKIQIIKKRKYLKQSCNALEKLSETDKLCKAQNLQCV